MFDIEGFLNDFEEEELEFKEKTVSINDFDRELAFHEASHFVFMCLTQQVVSGFKPIQAIISCAEKASNYVSDDGERFNCVSGFEPDAPEFVTVNEKCTGSKGERFEKFYKEIPKRLILKLLISIAGYSSYQIFISEKEYYIAKLDDFQSSKGGFIRLRCYTKESWLIFYEDIEDFSYIVHKLRFYHCLNNDQISNIINLLVEKAQMLMNIDVVNQSIRFVANKLLESKCEKIKGDHLKAVIKRVDEMLNVQIRSS